MGLLIREYVKRDGRGKSRKFQEIATFDYPGIFDTLYDPAKHRHFILHELRYPSHQFSIFSRHFGSSAKNPFKRGASRRIAAFHCSGTWRSYLLSLSDFFLFLPRKAGAGPVRLT